MAVRWRFASALICAAAAVLPAVEATTAATASAPVAEGAVVPFGDAAPAPGPALEDLVGLASTASGVGWWATSSTGEVAVAGDAVDAGSVRGALNSAVVGIAAVPGGAGYWLVAGDGGVF